MEEKLDREKKGGKGQKWCVERGGRGDMVRAGEGKEGMGWRTERGGNEKGRKRKLDEVCRKDREKR